MTHPKWKIVFLGTPEFSIPPLKALLNTEQVVAVFTQPDRPKGRGQKISASPIRQFADQYQIPCFQPEKIQGKETVEKIKSLDPDLIVVVAYGLFIPSQILSIPKHKTLNIHPSLLPQYRGAAPMQWSLINGDTKTGVTILYVTPEMDAGDMLLQKEIIIDPNDTFETLHDRLSNLGASLLIETILGLKNNSITPVRQDPSQVTLAPKLTKEMGKIQWNKSAKEIFNLIRGANPWPGTYSSINGESLKICAARLVDEDEKEAGQPGKICDLRSDGIVIETSQGRLLLTEIQKPNKRKMTASEFLRGYRLNIGSFFDA